MAEEAVPVAVPAPKPRKKPSVSFGSLLDIEGNGKPWTVSEMDGDTAVVTRRVGNVMEERHLSAKELEEAIARPLPKNVKAKASPFALRGLSLNKTLDIPDALGGFARITGVDSLSGDVRVDIPGRGAAWVPKSAVQDMVLSEGDREKGLAGFKEALGVTEEEKPKAKKPKSVETAPVEEAAAAPTITPAPVVSPSEPEASATQAIRETVEEPSATQARAVPVAATPARPSVVVSKTVSVGSPESASVKVSGTTKATGTVKTSGTVETKASISASAQPTIRETRAQLKADIQAQGQIQTGGSVSGAISGSVAVPGAAVALPSAVSASVAAYATPRSAAMQALELTVKAAVGAFRAPPTANADRAVEQTALLTQATGALATLQSRVADRRAAISELQGQADALRQEIGTLNQMRAAGPAVSAGPFRAPAPPTNLEATIQEKSQQLGALQNKLASSRFSLLKEDGQAQQLRIAVNLMQRVAPEASEGRVPQAVIDLVAASIPKDLPIIQPVALSPTTTAPASAPTAAAPATPRSFAPGVAPVRRVAPSQIQRDGGGGQLSQSVRARLTSGGMAMPMASAVALQTGQDADRRSDYTEGLGSPDAYQAGVGGGGETGEPVLATVPQSYADVDEAEFEAGEDIFGSEGARQQEFMRAQQQSKFAQEQFLPGTTPNLRTELGAQEKARQQRARPTAAPQGPGGDLSRARNVNADTQRLRAQGERAQEAQRASQEEEALQLAAGGSSRVEQMTRLRSWLMDLIGLATAMEFIGFLELLINMNGRVVAAQFRKGSITRKIFPAAIKPYEYWGILSIDLMIFSALFVVFCVIMAPLVIFLVVDDLGLDSLFLFFTG